MKRGTLREQLNSSYIEAANRLMGKNARRRIVAYVESFDDVFFWSNLLRPLETEKVYFEVMLPSRRSLQKGKRSAIANHLGHQLGEYMIACVDADYDYLLQGATELSMQVCSSPYVFHTYAYAIESFQCYAPSLQNVCVMATLNDRRLFPFEEFMRQYSETIWPLLVWNVWCYRYGKHKLFSLSDFYNIVAIPKPDIFHPELSLEKLRHRVNAKMARLQKEFPEGKKTYKPLRAQMLRLGATPQTAYLFMRGHDLYDGVVAPLLGCVGERLRREREREIRNLAVHATQEQNELSSYQHSTSTIDQSLRRHLGYVDCPLYQRIQADVRSMMEHMSDTAENSPSVSRGVEGE